jgi:hypothetical protein
MLLASLAITTAQAAQLSAVALAKGGAPSNLTIQANFVYGSGGTTADTWVQTSLDGGATWTDIANFHFTTASARFIYNLSAATPKTTQVTPTDGTLAANTSVDGVLGPMFRAKSTTVGTYATSTTLSVNINAGGVSAPVAVQ